MNFHNITFEASYGTTAQLPPSDCIEIAFSGRSNVGKSSMINAIFNRKQLARVSASPGKTTTINFFRLDDVRFADLPGYGYAKVSKSEKQRWSKLMEGYFGSQRNLQLVFQLIDARHPPAKDDMVMLDFLIEAEIPFVVALTKVDKLRPMQRKMCMDNLKDEIPFADSFHMVPFSARTGEGVEEIHKIIEEIVQKEPPRD